MEALPVKGEAVTCDLADLSAIPGIVQRIVERHKASLSSLFFLLPLGEDSLIVLTVHSG